MKYIVVVCVLIVVGSVGAAAQIGGALSNEPQVFTMPSHPEHATKQPLADERSLLDSSAYVSAKGERPLWETPQQVTYVMPLGDVARLLRKEHEAAKKAVLVKEN